MHFWACLEKLEIVMDDLNETTYKTKSLYLVFTLFHLSLNTNKMKTIVIQTTVYFVKNNLSYHIEESLNYGMELNYSSKVVLG